MQRRQPLLRIAIDTGGTFTDCVWTEAGRLRMLKVFSTPADPSQAIVEAIRQITRKDDFIVLKKPSRVCSMLSRSELVVNKFKTDASAQP